MKKTAAWLARYALEQIGARYTFGIPGVHNIELYDELNQSQLIIPVLVTHEMSAAFMADAVSRTTDDIGVLAIVPAAGITHAMSGIGEAYLDGIPMLVISGGVRTDIDKRFQLHDLDQCRLLAPLTKAVHRVTDYSRIVPTIYEAYDTAVSGEPGPVFVELPANMQMFTGEVPELPPYPGRGQAPPVDAGTVAEAAELLAQASQPGIFVGWGARRAADTAARIAERLGAPVATTLQGLDAFPGDHPLHTGMGFGGSAVPAAENAFAECDAMLAVGTRFAEIATGSFGAEPPEALVHVDINPTTVGANYPARIGIVGDAQAVLAELDRALAERLPEARDSGELAGRIARDKAEYLDEWRRHDSGSRVNPGRFFEALRAALDDDGIVIADDGNHTFLTAELMPIHRGGMFASPTDFNCMGYCVPAAIAAKLAHPDRQVVGIVGDGAYLMSGGECVTAATLDVGCVWFIFDDGELSQIAQAQAIPYNRKTCTVLGGYDYAAHARATGCEYVAIADDSSIESGIDAALAQAAENRPVVVDVRIDYSKRTRFTAGTVKTNLQRFSLANKLRFVGRALKRRVTG